MFLKRRVGRVDTMQRYWSQCVHALVGVTAHQKKSFRSNYDSQPTHGTRAVDLMLARALFQS